VDELKLAQAGLLVTENVSASPSASLAPGVNEYDLPAWTDPSGVPPIVGAAFGPTT
jgi:hypothetical protein